MPIDSTSSLEDVEAAYDDNASYAETQDVAKAKLFVTAVRVLLRRLFSSQGQGEATLGFRIDLLREELTSTQTWLEKRDPDSAPQPRVTFADFQNFRAGTGARNFGGAV